MGSSQVEIFNLALGHVGTRPVTSPTEVSVEAETCSRSWDSCRRDTLAGNNWPFATAIEALTEVGNYTPPTGWSYAFQYPPKCLAMWKLYPEAPAEPYIDNDFQMPLLSAQNFARKKAGEPFKEIFVPSLNIKVILTNCPSPFGEYTYDLEDTTLYSPAFARVMSYKLGADIAMPLTGDPNIALNLMKIFNAQMSDAQRTNSYENNQDQRGDTGAADARA